MAIQLKRCTTEERLASTIVLANGQPLYDTDLRVLYIGDGVTTVKDLEPIGTANLSGGDGVASIVMKTGNDPEVDYINIAQGPANFAVGDGNKIYDTLNASGKTGTKKNFVSGTQNELGVDGTYVQVNSNLVSGQINTVGINGTTSANMIGGYKNIVDQGSYNIVSGHGNKLKTKLDDYEYSYAAASNKSILSGEYNKGYYLLDSIVSGNANDVRYVDSSLIVGKSNTITRSADVSESNVALTAVAPVYILGSNNNDTANTRTGRFKYWILGDNNNIEHDNVIVVGKNNTTTNPNQIVIGHGDTTGKGGYIRFSSPIRGGLNLHGDTSLTDGNLIISNGRLTTSGSKGASISGNTEIVSGTFTVSNGETTLKKKLNIINSAGASISGATTISSGKLTANAGLTVAQGANITYGTSANVQINASGISLSGSGAITANKLKVTTAPSATTDVVRLGDLPSYSLTSTKYYFYRFTIGNPFNKTFRAFVEDASDILGAGHISGIIVSKRDNLATVADLTYDDAVVSISGAMYIKNETNTNFFKGTYMFVPQLMYSACQDGNLQIQFQPTSTALYTDNTSDFTKNESLTILQSTTLYKMYSCLASDAEITMS